MRDRRRNRRIVGGEALVFAETAADRLIGGSKGVVIAYNSNTAGQSGELHRPPGASKGLQGNIVPLKATRAARMRLR